MMFDQPADTYTAFDPHTGCYIAWRGEEFGNHTPHATGATPEEARKALYFEEQRRGHQERAA